MKIGIDLDEVTADLMSQLLKFYYKKTGRLIKKENFNSYNWWDVWGGTREEAIKIYYQFYDSEEFDNIKPIEKAIESINYLGDKNELFIITSRPFAHKEKTEKWIEKYLSESSIKIIYSNDFYGKKGNSKAAICKRLGIKLIIEDLGKYALECAQSDIKAILFDRPWNKEYEHPNIKRVHNWQEAIAEIEKLSQNP
ncbi:MAG: hypothetical protein IIA87_03850 [Nanoarchaeota archaeon]|nr:hypothetical protein [Nanoarchaeota archaeon]